MVRADAVVTGSTTLGAGLANAHCRKSFCRTQYSLTARFRRTPEAWHANPMTLNLKGKTRW